MTQVFERSSVSADSNLEVIERFASRNRLKTRVDVEDGTKIIPGKYGHVYEFGDGRLGVMVMPDPPRRQYWGFIRTVLLKLGFVVLQNGDGEGAATFNANNPEQAKAAVRAARIKRKRQISPEQRERQIARLRASAGRAPRGSGTRRKPLIMREPDVCPVG